MLYKPVEVELPRLWLIIDGAMRARSELIPVSLLRVALICVPQASRAMLYLKSPVDGPKGLG